MLNYFKKVLFSFYIWYQIKSPIKKGNAFFGRLIQNLKPIKYQINGLNFKLNPVSYIDFHLIVYGTHDDEVKNWLNIHLNENDLFLDIGANIGYFSIYAAKIKKAKVISFEPSIRELSQLYNNISINKLNNIIIYPFALGNERSQAKLNVSNYHNPGKNSFIHLADDTDATKQIVDIYTLGDLVSIDQIKKIKLIKIDVEGFEYQVLQGLNSIMNFLENTIFIIEITSYIETDPEMIQTNSIYKFFDSFNYQPQTGIRINEQYNEVFTKA